MLVTTEQKRVVSIARAKYELWVEVMSGMVWAERIETWRRGVDQPRVRCGRANEMLELWNGHMEALKFHTRWPGWMDMQVTDVEAMVVPYITTKIGYTALTAEIDDFIRFAGVRLFQYVSAPMEMQRGLTDFFNEKLTAVVASVVLVCARRAERSASAMTCARFVYFLRQVDREDVNVESRRQLGRAFTRFSRFE